MSDTDPDWAPSLKLGYGKPADGAALTARYVAVGLTDFIAYTSYIGALFLMH